MKDDELEKEIRALAMRVRETRQQQAWPFPIRSRAEAERLRNQAKTVLLRHGFDDVSVWICEHPRSKAKIMTPAEARYGFGLRFSPVKPQSERFDQPTKPKEFESGKILSVPVTQDLENEIIRLAKRVQETQEQQAWRFPLPSRHEAEVLRETAKLIIRKYNLQSQQPISNVMVWVVEHPRSGARIMTPEEAKYGFGLRFSPFIKEKKTGQLSKHYNKNLSRKDNRESPAHISELCSTTHITSFEQLFDLWAEQACKAAPFKAEKPRYERIPPEVRQKVFRLWQEGFCYSGDTPASFQLKDAKRGGPYHWFTYSPMYQTIYANHEYFVQVAAYHDLIFEYNWPSEYIWFEFGEYANQVYLPIDIAIIEQKNNKIYIEVKETEYQIQNLIINVKQYGLKGVDLGSPDRGNDPLRKAKYIAAGRPPIFAFYSPHGFTTFGITYIDSHKFLMKPISFPKK